MSPDPTFYPVHPGPPPRPVLTFEGWLPLLLPLVAVLGAGVGIDAFISPEPPKETPPMSATTNLDLDKGTRAICDRIEHVHIASTDVDRSIDFYRRVFGWEVRHDGTGMFGRCAHVGTDRFYIALSEVRSVSDGGGFMHIGLTTPDLQAFRHRLAEEGVEITEEADRPEGAAVYFNDPDGYEYEVVEYRSDYVYR